MCSSNINILLYSNKLPTLFSNPLKKRQRLVPVGDGSGEAVMLHAASALMIAAPSLLGIRPTWPWSRDAFLFGFLFTEISSF